MERKLILMRHGNAARDIFKRPGDAGGKELTQKGRAQVGNMAEQLIRAGIVPDVILHSPSPRAQETAAVLASAYRAVGKEVATREDPLLGNDYNQIPQAIKKLGDEQTALAVSHMMDIDDATNKLTGRPIAPACAESILIKMNAGEWRDTLTSSNTIERRFRPAL